MRALLTTVMELLGLLAIAAGAGCAGAGLYAEAAGLGAAGATLVIESATVQYRTRGGA